MISVISLYAKILKKPKKYCNIGIVRAKIVASLYVNATKTATIMPTKYADLYFFRYSGAKLICIRYIGIINSLGMPYMKFPPSSKKINTPLKNTKIVAVRTFCVMPLSNIILLRGPPEFLVKKHLHTYAALADLFSIIHFLVAFSHFMMGSFEFAGIDIEDFFFISSGVAFLLSM